jgi:hypothetical protein
MARAFRSVLRPFTGLDGARALARPLRRDLASAASVRARRPCAARLRRGVLATRFVGFRGRVRAFGEEVLGAKVDGVALGFRAFGVEIADGAALGLLALGLTEEAAALGLDAFGPVAAGAEPGVETKTPWAIATSAKTNAAQMRGMMNKRSEIEGISPSVESGWREPA